MLVWAIVAVVIVTGLVFAGDVALRASSNQSESAFRTHGQALDVARAGLVDAYAWLRRQPAQPVVAFAPQRDLRAVPPVNETDDPAIGLVREFEITPGYWARYEVRVWDDLDGDGRADLGEGVSDATLGRSLPGAGVVWHLESRGIVYRRMDPGVAWNQEPNRRVSGAVVSCEARRLNLLPPAAAALCCSRGDRVTVASRGRVDGGAAGGAVFPSGTGVPSVSGELTGMPGFGTVPGYDGTPGAVFGMSTDDLRAMSTIRIAGGEALPDPLPDFSLVFVDGDHTVTPATPLRGTGVLFVNGNLTIAANSNSYFTGLVYVTGNYEQNAPSLLRGTVIAGGTARLAGVGDLSELVHDPDILDQLLVQMGRYRLSRAMHRMDASPLEGVR